MSPARKPADDESPPSADELNAGWRDRIAPYTYATLGTSITRANGILSRTVEDELADLDLSMSKYGILAVLDGAGDRSMNLKAVSRATFIPPATLTYVLDQLEQRSLVRRVASKQDRRSVLAEITEQGHELIMTAQERLLACNWGLSGLNETEAYLAVELLNKIQPVPLADEGRTRESVRRRSRTAAG